MNKNNALTVKLNYDRNRKCKAQVNMFSLVIKLCLLLLQVYMISYQVPRRAFAVEIDIRKQFTLCCSELTYTGETL